jgi:YesN/AraC family two-component response regulator
VTGHVWRTVIVDDHELLRAGTRGILEEATGFVVVGEAADAEAARRVVTETHPELVITDIRLPTATGSIWPHSSSPSTRASSS